MSAFLATMTDTGRELVAAIRDARRAEDIAALLEQYKTVAVAGLVGGPGPSDADQFGIACAIAEFLPASDRRRAAHWEAAALTAIRSKAHAEALAALEKAEGFARSKDRQRWMGLLRELLVARRDVPTSSFGHGPKPQAKRTSGPGGT